MAVTMHTDFEAGILTPSQIVRCQIELPRNLLVLPDEAVEPRPQNRVQFAIEQPTGQFAGGFFFCSAISAL